VNIVFTGLGGSWLNPRVMRLEATGVITGYRAEVDLTKAGFVVLAVVWLKYPGSRHEPLRRLLERRWEILECLRTTGDDCYVLKVAATSMAHLEQIVNELAASAVPPPASSTAPPCPIAARARGSPDLHRMGEAVAPALAGHDRDNHVRRNAPSSRVPGRAVA
jgi:DNA-binding Lrp family transcriptional regulator